jgi:hypothetical protein
VKRDDKRKKTDEHGMGNVTNDRWLVFVGGGAGALVGFTLGSAINQTYEYTITNNSFRPAETKER